MQVEKSFQYKNLGKLFFKLIELLSEFMNLEDERSIFKNKLYFYMLAINNMKRKNFKLPFKLVLNIKYLVINLTKKYKTLQKENKAILHK